MAHIHTGHGQHDFTASAYIVRLDLPQPAILFHQHRLLKKWLQFGGHVELDESPWHAVCREIREESGYDPGQLKILQPKTRAGKTADAVVHPQPIVLLTHQFGDEPGKHYHTDIGFAFVTRKAPAHKVGADESDTMQALTRDEIAALPAGAIPANVRDTALLLLDEYLPDWKPFPVSNWQ